MTDTVTASLGELPGLAAGKHGSTAFLCDLPWTAYGQPVVDISGFASAVHDYADRFWAAGVRPGDQVAVVQRNHIEVQALAYGLCRIGALPVLLSAGIVPGEIVECLTKLDTPYVVVDALTAARLHEHRDAVTAIAKRVLYLTPAGGDVADGVDLSWSTPTGDRATHEPHPRGADEWAVVTHTSGTTDVPKLAAHSTSSLYGVVASQIRLSRAQGDVALSAKHMSFVHARTCSVVLAFLEVAMPILAIADARPEPVRHLLLAHRPDSMETHPNIFIQWEPIAAHPSRPFGPVQRFLSTFDAIHPRTVRAMLDGSDRPDAYYLQAYGQTETGAVALRRVSREEVATYRPRDLGRPVPNAEVRIVDEAGEPLPAGQAGLIESYAPGRFRGYIGRDHTPVDDHWWGMGDIGRLSSAGTLELLDRIVDHTEGTDSILEVEDELLDSLTDLVELVLLKEVAGHDVVAVVCPRDGGDVDLGRFHDATMKTALGPVPVYVMAWESLPVTGSYKVRRLSLRARLSAPDAPAPIMPDAQAAAR
jgi:acyl-coenzyme A synthetase/AMP-(fatty) acid ligase